MGGTTPKQASPSPKIKGVATPHLNINIFFLKEKAQEDKAHKRNFKDKRVLKKKKKKPSEDRHPQVGPHSVASKAHCLISGRLN